MAKNLIGSLYYDYNKTSSKDSWNVNAVQKGTHRMRVTFDGEQEISVSQITERNDVEFSSLISDEVYFTVLAKSLSLPVSTQSFQGQHTYPDSKAVMLISGGGSSSFSEPISPTIKKDSYYSTLIEGSFQYSSSDYICDDIIKFDVTDTARYNVVSSGAAVVEVVPFWN